MLKLLWQFSPNFDFLFIAAEAAARHGHSFLASPPNIGGLPSHPQLTSRDNPAFADPEFSALSSVDKALRITAYKNAFLTGAFQSNPIHARRMFYRSVELSLVLKLNFNPMTS